jgi:hypothetical protein
VLDRLQPGLQGVLKHGLVFYMMIRGQDEYSRVWVTLQDVKQRQDYANGCSAIAGLHDDISRLKQAN